MSVDIVEQQRIGANVTIFARGQTSLDEAKDEILASRREESQQVAAIAADLGTPSTVSRRPAQLPRWEGKSKLAF